MTVETFLANPVEAAPTRPLRALWYAAHGDWEAAHAEVQVGEDRDSAWVHALLHREEGDRWNAAYWYGRSGKPVYKGSIKEERGQMIAVMLSDVGGDT